MRAEVNEHGVLDIDQATELFDRLEAAEQALDFHTQRDRELKALLSMLSDRLDEFSYDELSSLIEDEPMNQWGESYKSRLEQAEQAVARVRESHTEYVISEWDLGANSFKLDEEGRTVPMASLCLECSGDEPIADAEDGNCTEDSDNSVYYPCPTLRALDGEQA